MSARMLFLMVVGAGLMALRCPAEEQATKERIGVYDSRCITITAINVYLKTPAGQKEMADKRAAYDKAKTAGDQQTCAAIENEMKAKQIKAHQQGFGTAPVDEFLERIKNKLPDIQKKAGVSALVSKWDEKELKKYKGATQVDVTEALVDAFGPDANLRAGALSIQKQKPVSNKQLENVKD